MTTYQRIIRLTGNGALTIDESRTIAGTTITRKRNSYQIEWPDQTVSLIRYMAMSDEAHDEALQVLREMLLGALCESAAGAA